jgi:hypothetical protein
MGKRSKDNYEPPSREKWLEYQFHEFKGSEDKADVDRMARKTGMNFLVEFKEHKESLRKSGMSIANAWQTAIRDFADRVPTRDELKKRGTYTKYERNRRSSRRQENASKLRVDDAMSRLDLHKALAGKPAKIEDVDWVAEHLFPGLDILSLEPKDIPSRIALNMLDSAKDNQPEFWKGYRDELSRRANKRTSLSDSGRSHVEVMGELFAERDVFDAMMETADVAVGT